MQSELQTNAHKFIYLRIHPEHATFHGPLQLGMKTGCAPDIGSGGSSMNMHAAPSRKRKALLRRKDLTGSIVSWIAGPRWMQRRRRGNYEIIVAARRPLLGRLVGPGFN